MDFPTLSDLYEVLEKGRKPFPVGTMRIWAGQKYVKHPEAWIAVGGSKHGQALNSHEATHKDIADTHLTHASAEPVQKPQEGEPVASNVRQRLIPQLSIKAPDENDSWSSWQVVNAQGYAIISGMSSKEYAEETMNRQIKIGELEATAHLMSSEKFRKLFYPLQYHGRGKLPPKNSTVMKNILAKHKALVQSAIKEGFTPSAEVFAEYPEYAPQSALPEGMQAEINEKTNLYKHININKVSKANKAKVIEMLNHANIVFAEMGLKLKVPLTFMATTSLSKPSKRWRGHYTGGGSEYRGILLHDNTDGGTTVMHEIGHAVDYAIGTTERASVTRSEEPGVLRENPDFKAMKDLVIRTEYYTFYRENASEHRAHDKYLNKPTEIFARAFELYSLAKAIKLVKAGKIPQSFVDDFLPDGFRARKPGENPEAKAIFEAQRKAHLDLQYKEQTEWNKFRDEKIAARPQGQEEIEALKAARAEWENHPTRKAYEKSKVDYLAATLEYNEKIKRIKVEEREQERLLREIEPIMDRLLANEQIRKAIDLTGLLELLQK